MRIKSNESNFELCWQRKMLRRFNRKRKLINRFHWCWAGWQGGKIPRAGKSASGKLGKSGKAFHGGEGWITDFGKLVVGGIGGT